MEVAIISTTRAPTRYRPHTNGAGHAGSMRVVTENPPGRRDSKPTGGSLGGNERNPRVSPPARKGTTVDRARHGPTTAIGRMAQGFHLAPDAAPPAPVCIAARPCCAASTQERRLRRLSPGPDGGAPWVRRRRAEVPPPSGMRSVTDMAYAIRQMRSPAEMMRLSNRSSLAMAMGHRSDGSAMAEPSSGTLPELRSSDISTGDMAS